MPVAVVCHDSGGAEILSSFIRRSGTPAIFCLSGPAQKVFERKLGQVRTVALETAIRECSTVLCATSWQSDIEVGAIKLARELGKHSTAFLDHWVNYRSRFERWGGTHLPDELVVFDPMAEAIARAIFPSVPITVMANPYFADLEEEIVERSTNGSVLPAGGHRILYVCEPISEHAAAAEGTGRNRNYDEKDALRYFLSNLSALDGAVESIRIRPHPAEAAGKYSWLYEEFDLPLLAGGGRPLIDEIIEADLVVGCESMAMVVGLLARKRVISCIPPGGASCVLPFPEIVNLQQLLEQEL